MSDYARVRVRERAARYGALSLVFGSALASRSLTPKRPRLLISEAPDSLTVTILPETPNLSGFWGLLRRVSKRASSRSEVETITVTAKSLAISSGPSGSLKEYALNRISNFQLLTAKSGGAQARSKVQFDCESETTCFGVGLERIEAERALKAIMKRLKRYLR